MLCRHTSPRRLIQYSRKRSLNSSESFLGAPYRSCAMIWPYLTSPIMRLRVWDSKSCPETALKSSNALPSPQSQDLRHKVWDCKLMNIPAHTCCYSSRAEDLRSSACVSACSAATYSMHIVSVPNNRQVSTYNPTHVCVCAYACL